MLSLGLGTCCSPTLKRFSFLSLARPAFCTSFLPQLYCRVSESLPFSFLDSGSLLCVALTSWELPAIVLRSWLLYLSSQCKIINSSSHVCLISQQLKTSLSIVYSQRNAEVHPYWTRLCPSVEENKTETSYLPQPLQDSSFFFLLFPSFLLFSVIASINSFVNIVPVRYAFTYFFYTQILYTEDTICFLKFILLLKDTCFTEFGCFLSKILYVMYSFFLCYVFFCNLFFFSIICPWHSFHVSICRYSLFFKNAASGSWRRGFSQSLLAKAARKDLLARFNEYMNSFHEAVGQKFWTSSDRIRPNTSL